MRNQRGSVLVFTMIVLVFLWIVAGTLGYDVAHLVSDRGELQTSLDAAALAGAGKLGFDNTAFPAARDFAVMFATKSMNRSGTVVLDRNDANNPDAPNSVLLGIWDPTKAAGVGAGLRFEPSLDGTRVNAVLCKYTRSVTPSFLRFWGLLGMTVSAQAIATANPPTEPTECVFPIGVSDCAFKGATSSGCGSMITLSTSSGHTPLTTSGTNTGAWVSLNSEPPSAENIRNQINAAMTGACSAPTATELDAGGGVMQSAYTVMFDAFKVKFGEAATYTVTRPNSSGDPIVTYDDGHGWKVAIPVLNTGSCTAEGGVAGNINDTYPISGWSEMVITQVISKGQCAVVNPKDTNSAALCEALTAGTPIEGLNNPKSLNAVFGYYSCPYNPSPPRIDPSPRTALAQKLRLVK
jgi:hypothetical protein